jgi:hypothetical protein
VSRPRRDGPDRAPVPAPDGDLDWLADLCVRFFVTRERFEDAQLVRHEAARLAALDDVADRALALARWTAAMPGIGDLGPDGLSWGAPLPAQPPAAARAGTAARPRHPSGVTDGRAGVLVVRHGSAGPAIGPRPPRRRRRGPTGEHVQRLRRQPG